MRLLFFILLLPFLAPAQSSNLITVTTESITNLNGRKGKNIERLFDGNLTTKLDATGVSENDWVIPYRSMIRLPNAYGNMKYEVYEGSGAGGTFTLRLYNSSKTLLGSYTIAKSAFNSWVTVNPAQNMHAQTDVCFVEVYLPTTTDLNIGDMEVRLYGDVTGAAPQFYPGTTITAKTDPGKQGHGINVIDDRIQQYLAGSPATLLFPLMGAAARIGYEGPRFDVYPNAYTNPLTNITFNLNRFGGNDHINTRVLNFTRPRDIKVQFYHIGANIKQLSEATASTSNGVYLPATTDIQKFKYLEPGADSSLAASWEGLAELHYNIAALWGTNTSADLTGKTITNGNATAGQGGLDVQEVGNEFSKDWNGTRAHYSPYVYYQLIKTVYARTKQADPNMPVFTTSLTYMDTTYWKALYFWHYWENGLTPFPCDGINMNIYINTDLDGQGTNVSSTALNPESWGLYARLTALKALFDKIFPNKDFNVSENGVATDDGSPFDANAIGGKTDRQVAADLMLRNKAIFQTIPFVTTYYYYAFFDDGTSPFNSMALTAMTFNGAGGSYSGNTVYAQGYALANELDIEDDYEWWSTIVTNGGTSSAWITSKDHQTDPLKKVFKVWMPTMNGSTSSVNIPVGENATAATLYTLNYSAFTATTSTPTIAGTNVSVTATEGMQWLEVTYSEEPENQLPTAAAGTDQTITLPTSQVTVNGSSSSDPDGTIDTYLWTKISGPATFTITNPNNASTTITGLVQGTYVFRLTVTDNDAATDTDDIQVVVNAAPVPSNRRQWFRGWLRNIFRN